MRTPRAGRTTATEQKTVGAENRSSFCRKGFTDPSSRRAVVPRWFKNAGPGGEALIFEELHDECFHLAGTVRRKPFAHRKNDIHCLGKQGPVQPKKFPDNPFDPVSPDSLWNSVNADAQPGFPAVVRRQNQAELAAPQTFPLPIYPFVITGLGQQACLGQ
jgi:hypothetical protein